MSGMGLIACCGVALVLLAPRHFTARVRLLGANGSNRPWGTASGPRGAFPAVRQVLRGPRADDRTQLDRWPATIQQMAALLSAGTEPAVVWRSLERQLLRETARGDGSDGQAVPPVQAGHGPGTTAPDSSARGAVARDVLRLMAAGRQGAELGLPTGATLRAARLEHPRSGAIRDSLAASWEVALSTGAPLAGVLIHLADAVEDDLDALGARDTALAGPKSTARILSSLPLLGLGLGLLMGTDPLGVLLGMAWGHLALVAGIGLSVAGVLWTRRLVHQAEEDSP